MSSDPDSQFLKASNTIVVSDIHLADAEPPHPYNPLWKRFKRPKYFVDRTFKAFLEHLSSTIPGPIELIFNGDIFDFDSVMALPQNEKISLSWLERRRGMGAEEHKSRFKMLTILRDHAVWAEAVGAFVAKGNRAVFVIGNHDMELHWPSVRAELVASLRLDAEGQSRVRFCEWFYISNGDTLIEHGNQYDAYTLAQNPIHPLIHVGPRVEVRIPFGNLAGKYMLNGMGLFNPHAESSFIKSSLREYMVFFYKYIARTQPLLMFTWFWSALVTGVVSVTEGLLPAMRDPLTVDSRVEDIARRSNATPQMVWTLKELHAHPAIFNPLKILRELWLDRVLLLGLVIFAGWEFMAFLHLFGQVSWWWFVVPIVLLTPGFVFYARSVESQVIQLQKPAFEAAPLAAHIARVRRVIQGHTHIEKHSWVQGVEYLNTGTWSPAFEDVECTQPYGRKCFAWVKPAPDGASGRTAELYEWREGGAVLVRPEPAPELQTRKGA